MFLLKSELANISVSPWTSPEKYGNADSHSVQWPLSYGTQRLCGQHNTQLPAFLSMEKTVGAHLVNFHTRTGTWVEPPMGHKGSLEHW